MRRMPSTGFIYSCPTRECPLLLTGDRISYVHTSRTSSAWRYNGSRQKRPMSSIVLEPGVKEMILDDCKDFLESEDWYVLAETDHVRVALLTPL
jgi:hypothetical protein